MKIWMICGKIYWIQDGWLYCFPMGFPDSKTETDFHNEKKPNGT